MTTEHCPYFSQGLYIGSLPTGDTQISMCCWQDKKTVDTVSFSTDYLIDIRATAQQQLPSQCSEYCKMPGYVANERERSIKEWQDVVGTNPTELKLTTLHLEQSLICNLKCISCSSRYSSAWNQEYHLFDASAPQIQLTRFPEEKWRNLDLSDLRRLHFTGGEPLLNKDNKKILQHLDSIGVLHNVFISYNTNGTIRPDQETLDLWRRCRFVRLFFSLDGIGSVLEYTRYPAQWQQIQDNIQYFRSLSDICILIEVDAIVGVHNVFSLQEFFDWWTEHCQTGSQGDPSSVFVRRIEPSSHGGRVLDLKHLTKNQASLAVSMLQSMTQYAGVGNIINYIKNNNTPGTEWLDYFTKLDHLRGTDWQQSLSKYLKEVDA